MSLPDPRLTHLIDRMDRVLEARIGFGGTLQAIRDERHQALLRQTHGLPVPAPHPIVDRLMRHREAVLGLFLNEAEQFIELRHAQLAAQDAFKAAQRTRYMARKTWQALPAGTPAEVDAKAERAMELAEVEMDRVRHVAEASQRALTRGQAPLGEWGEKLHGAHIALLRAHNVTPAVPTLHRALSPDRVPPASPAPVGVSRPRSSLSPR
jgi:hypothetical protein